VDRNGWCGGNTIAFIDAMNPAVEDVVTGVYFDGKPITLRQPSVPELGMINLVYHPILMPQDSMAYATMEMALNGELDPYVLVVEGTLFDEFGVYYKKPSGSFWCSAGRKPDGSVLLCDEFVLQPHEEGLCCSSHRGLCNLRGNSSYDHGWVRGLLLTPWACWTIPTGAYTAFPITLTRSTNKD